MPMVIMLIPSADLFASFVAGFVLLSALSALNAVNLKRDMLRLCARIGYTPH